MRPIDADKLIAKLEDDAKHMEDLIAVMFTYGAISDIKQAETVDVQPVRHGHWVYGEDEDGVDGYRCNKCGFFVTWDYQHSHIHFIDDYLFCPHCNARMDEVK